MVELAIWGSGVPDLAPGQIRRPPPPCPVSHSHSHVLSCPHANFQPPTMSLGLIFILGVLAPCSAPLDFFRQTHPQVVIPMPSATHMQIFSLLACRLAGFLFWGFW